MKGSVTARKLRLVRFLIGVTILGLGLSTCALAKEKRQKAPPTGSELQLVLDDPANAVQTRGKVTLEVKAIGLYYDFPHIFGFSDEEISQIQGYGGNKVVDLNVFAYYPKDKATGKRYLMLLKSPDAERFFPAFWIKLRNDTDHIINFSKDAKVYFQAPGSEEPVPPVTDLLMDVDTKLLAWEAHFQQTRKKGLLDIPYPVGLAAGAFNYRFGRWQESGFQNKEVLPGMSASGLMIFGSVIEKTAANQEASLLFYEVPTETNAAGEVTVKSRFVFKYRAQLVKEWLDREAGRWKVGEPPQLGEE